jgi:hypothetical protein
LQAWDIVSSLFLRQTVLPLSSEALVDMFFGISFPVFFISLIAGY